MIKKTLLVSLFIGGSLLISACSNKESVISYTNNSSFNSASNSTKNSSFDLSSNYSVIMSKNTSSNSSFTLNEKIKRVQVVTDDAGIYSAVIYLSNKIGDKGNLECVYKGAKGSAQENSIVATYTLDYSLETTGYEVKTYYNGETYQNFHKQEEIKFVMEFGASIRASDVTISYTPDGGSKEQIFYSSEACYYHN